MQQKIAIAARAGDLISTAEKLADELGIPFFAGKLEANSFLYLLLLTHDYLGLLKPGDKKPFHLDFLSGKIHYRSQQAGLRKELLARAMGMKPGEQPVIVDATAGLGRDSFILATLGFEVIMLERSPVLFALLRDAMDRARTDTEMRAVIERMHLVHADAHGWLQSPPPIDIVYLDPMFPERQKSASVKKEMVILQELLGKDEDADSLFQLALTCAARRVVVKRPRLAVNIGERAPNFTLTGKSSRFDIYLTKRP
jgi:16S rRNA (guanine1516-N2)-methyltransferase